MGGDLVANRFDEKPFFHTLLRFSSYRDYKHNFPSRYISENFSSLSTISKILSKCDCIEVCVLNGTKLPILLSLVIDKPSGYKILCEPARYIIKDVKNMVLIFITFFSGDATLIIILKKKR